MLHKLGVSMQLHQLFFSCKMKLCIGNKLICHISKHKTTLTIFYCLMHTVDNADQLLMLLIQQPNSDAQ